MTRLKLALFGLAGMIAIGWYSKPYWPDFGPPKQELVYYTVTKADLPIVVTERGYLESQEQTSIKCKVETYDRRSGTTGVTVLSIVPNGSLVKKGDVLVELDSAAIRDRLETESLELQSDRSSLEQADARKKNQLTQNETSLAEAELALELAKLNRDMYRDEESGTFKLALAEIERQIDESRNSILEAQAQLKLQESSKEAIEELFRLGYKGKNDLEQSRINFMKAEAALAAAMNQLATHDASMKQLKTYTRQMELKTLQGEVDTATRNLAQVEVTNASELAQVNSQLYEAQERVRRQESRLEEYKRQIEYCTITAPHDGMVVYAQDENGRTTIAVGQSVHNRQELITLPDLTRMQVKTQIHEAVLDQVKKGLPVNVKVDAFPNRMYKGVVEHVAVVPSRSSKNVKTYECTVQIPQLVKSLKPGMTAVTEINVDRLKNVVSLPVQAVVQVEGDTWCYVDNGDGVQKRFVELGRNNDKFVQIINGVNESERAILNPLAISQFENQETREKDSDEVADTVAANEAESVEKVSVADSKP
jgi:HlyD family secretion protein